MGKQNSLCFGKISKFPVFSMTGIYFPCAVGTLNEHTPSGRRRSASTRGGGPGSGRRVVG